MKKLLLLCALCTSLLSASAQDATTYQTPPKEIADLLLAPPTPMVSISSNAQWMLLLERNPYPTVEELGQPELKIAGLRINPNNFSLTRQTLVKNLSVKNLLTGKTTPIKGLPTNLSASSFRWNPAESKIAFYQQEANRVDVYVIDVTASTCKKWNTKPANIVLNNSIDWLDDQTLLYLTTTHLPSELKKKPITPKGPTVQENLGKVAPSVTYQDMIKSPYDEYCFEFFGTGQLVKNKNGVETPIGQPSILTSVQASPDKKLLLTKALNKPFSYLVPAYGFASAIEVSDINGKLIKKLADLASAESTPSGYDNTQNQPRGYDWKDDEAATITYVMPLDSGLIKKKVPFHDAVYAWKAPFTETPKELFKTVNRYARTLWGNNELAMVYEQLRSKQTYKISRYNATSNSLTSLFEGNTTDAYRQPGQPLTQKNNFGRDVIATIQNNKAIVFNNTTGASPAGDLPFLSVFNLETKTNDIVWRSANDCFEFVADVLDVASMKILTRRETEKEVPNYYIKKVGTAEVKMITDFKNPYTALDGVTKQKVKYKRADGVDLTGDLYLPKNYNKEKDGPLPTLLWAYPREFTNAADASQIRGNQHKFIALSWGSPIFYVTQGFAILDNAEMPIVATSADKKPNDDFVNQLKLNASAAIDYLVGLGVSDRNRFAVGGHSYGAFMTANLLAHTSLFKAGIARSGAYNRTLTPFGFQNEERTYWQAPDLYHDMSPFSYADKIKTPILLIHGEADDNTGTYPINSERLYAAIKGHGGTVRFVYLPYEAHGYKGKENLLHLLWEQGKWLERYVK